ncbi:MAG: TIGR00282 family metallophosphoesterase [Dehalococcoidia bacterium]|nr:MAG: TIGR00282 family metallophosphoesterase [Dehalococcoidia bacterium]
MKVLMVGDVIGRPGRKAIAQLLPQLREQYGIDLIIANGENAAGGIGLTPDTANEFFQSGVNIITSGNHIWHHKEIIPVLDAESRIVRPLNMPPGVPGHGYYLSTDVLVVNIVGRVFMGHYDCPFRAMDRLLDELHPRPPIVIVDFHAEATAEKVAMGWYLNGRVSGVLGTHTHIGANDTRILTRGTAIISDVGMVGASDSVIGDDIDSMIDRFITMMPHRLSVGKGNTTFNSVLVEVEKDSGKALSINRIDLELSK